ncbi:MAG: PEP-CTERM sorting domain-containing protein [Fimbriimonadaceae bacterium]|jgi:hypothetical protein|nr:PEP-CTERM sorting domain-containing protein [Fimbriimonadaceae bacterium]
MLKRLVAIGLASVVLAGVSSASFTVATAQDPSASGTVVPMFFFDQNLNQISTAGATPGVSPVPGNMTVHLLGGATRANSSIVMAPVTVTPGAIPGLFTAGPGGVSFSDASGEYLKIDWDSATFFNGLLFGGQGATNNVRFSGTAVDGFGPASWTSRQFSFALANARPGPTANTTTYTASFTSSAVPEPFTMAALALGAGMIAARRRRKNS